MAGKGHTVKDWMNRGVISTSTRETIHEIGKAMREYGIGSLVVVKDDDEPIGIITSTDIINKVVAENFLPRKLLVDEVMSTELFTCSADEHIDDIAERMRTNGIKKLPVVNERKQLIGIITTTDVSTYCASGGAD